MASQDERDREAGKLGRNHLSVLRAYAERCATIAVRTNDPYFIQHGLIAIGLCLYGDDRRDTILLLPLHYDAAQRLKINPEEIFCTVGRLFPEKISNELISFLNRSEADKSLEAMGYTTNINEDGFRYKRTW